MFHFASSRKCTPSRRAITGDYSYSSTEASGFQYGAGNGCGQCHQYFVHNIVCMETWQRYDHRYKIIRWTIFEVTVWTSKTRVGWCDGEVEHTETFCETEVQTDNTCNRTCD